MGGVKLATFAVMGSLGLASLFTVPVALASPVPAADTAVKAAPTKRPTKKPAPTVTRTKTVAPPQQCNPTIGQPASALTSAPWPQQWLNFTDVWPLTEGDHVKVAVVDSGVDTSHKQLPHVDTYDETNTGKRDCLGHGTMVAGIIAAQNRQRDRIPFLGVAPKVHLISIKTAVTQQNNNPQAMPRGIRLAAQLGAKIINVSSQAPDYPALKSAVEFAQRKGALIVAAAGNTTPDKKAAEQELYPASYEGVLSVGAVGRDGKVLDFTDTKSKIAIVAPGQAVISTAPGNTYAAQDGTSFAAPYVAATAALVKAYHPNLTAQQIKNRLEETADGGTSVGSGHGMVNPLRAVTAVLPGENGQATTAVSPRPVAILTPSRGSSFTRTMALSFVGGSLGIAGAIVAAAIIIPAGRRRGWRPGRRATNADPGGSQG